MNLDRAWMNQDNADFYNASGVSLLQSTAERGGMASAPDVGLIWDQIRDSKFILDVGSGYGRSVGNLIQRDYQGCIDSVERSESLYQDLRTLESDNVRTYCSDIFKYQTDQKYDAILCMFSTITDFSKHEQKELVQYLSKFLKDKHSKMFFEAFPAGRLPLNCSTDDGSSYHSQYESHELNGYLPSLFDFFDYAQEIGMRVKQELYLTTTGRVRAMFEVFFEKNIF